MVGQAAVVELLAGPGGFTKGTQAHHARTALERMERTAHRGHRVHIIVPGLQFRQRQACGLNHFTRFFQEDLAHLRVVFQTAGSSPLLRQGRQSRGRQLTFRCQSLGDLGISKWQAQRRSAVVVQRQHGQALAAQGGRVGRIGIGALGGAIHGTGLLDHAVEIQRDRQGVGVDRAGAIADAGVEVVEAGRPLFAGHHRRQVACGRIKAEQRLGHLWLHADHVNQKAQGAQVVGQSVERTRGDGSLRVDLGVGQCIHIVAHAQHRLRRLIQPQHRQHTAHGRQLRRHRDQNFALRRVAEVVVDVRFNLGERGAQFLHHAAHGLPVGHTTVQLLHPQLERARVTRLANLLDALGQAAHAVGAVGVVKVAIVQRCIQVKQGRRHLHGQSGRRLARRSSRMTSRRLQGPSQFVTTRVEAGKRIADQGKLLCKTAQARRIATGHGRPHFLGGLHTLVSLLHQRRVEPAQTCLLVVNRGFVRQRIAGANCRQAMPEGHAIALNRLATEEQQIMGQPLGRLGQFACTQLPQQLGPHALAVCVGLQQAVRLGFKEGCRQLPQGGQAVVRAIHPRGACRGHGRSLGPGGQFGKPVAHARCHAGGRAPHQGQQVGFDATGGVVVRMTRRNAGVQIQLAPGPRHTPQISRVSTVGARQLLQYPVLRKQRQGRNGLARQTPPDEVKQGKGAALQGFHRRCRDQLGAGTQAQEGRLGCTQHIGGRAQPDELEHAHALVVLATGLSQHRRVDAVQVRALGMLLQVTAQGLVGGFQRTAQFFLHPRQGAEVVARHRARATDAAVVRVHCHDCCPDALCLPVS